MTLANRSLLVIFLAFSTAFSVYAFDKVPPTRRGIKFESNGLKLIGWLPYNPASLTTMPSIKLPNGETTLDFGATLVNYIDENGKARFVLSIATGRELDITKLRLIARDSKGLVFEEFRFSVCAADGEKQKVITFTGEISGDQKNLKQLLIVSDVRPNGDGASIGEQNDDVPVSDRLIALEEEIAKLKSSGIRCFTFWLG